MKRNHRELMAWQQAIDQVAVVHAATSSFPVRKESGLLSQLRRAAASVSGNAEKELNGKVGVVSGLLTGLAASN